MRANFRIPEYAQSARKLKILYMMRETAKNACWTNPNANTHGYNKILRGFNETIIRS